MVFTDWAGIPALIIFIGLLLSLLLGFAPEPQERFGVKLSTSLFLFGLGLFVLNAMSLAASWASQGDRDAQPADISTQFGLIPGEPYPLIIGDRIEGSTGEGYIRSGLFTTRGGFSIQPGSAVSVGFQHQENSYILELPMSGLTFVQDRNAEPSVVVYLQERSRQYYTSGVSYTYGPCEFVLQDFLLMCHKETLAVTYNLSESVIRGGLAPVVADNFTSATITLTPEMYAELLGE